MGTSLWKTYSQSCFMPVLVGLGVRCLSNRHLMGGGGVEHLLGQIPRAFQQAVWADEVCEVNGNEKDKVSDS